MLENLEPKNVFKYFEEICSIPHGSGNVDAISDYLVSFAKEHDLWVKQDELKNVIMIKEASQGKEDKPPVMIQGHMDMVAVKEPGTDIDLTRDSLKLAIDGDYVYAENTSLGGDDGIAVAFGLALLSDERISHPRIELVITTEEEVGMEGATAIDLTPCRGMQMLNIDSEEEGQFVAACAGGIRVNGSIPAKRMSKSEGRSVVEEDSKKILHWRKIMLTGFAGGHSGTEIDKNSGNANLALGWFLNELSEEVDIKLAALQGGLKDNAIPIEAWAVVGVEEKAETAAEKEDMVSGAGKFEQVCRRLEKEIQSRYKDTDPDCRVELAALEDKAELKQYLGEEQNCLKPEDCAGILSFLTEAPNGVCSMSKELDGLVQTSLNLGIMKLEKDEMQVSFSLRSSVAQEKEELKERVCGLVEKYHGTVSTTGDYPAWEYKKESPLREHMVAVYEKQYGKKPLILSLHAGLECGILAAKKPGLDCVSFGPDILDIHTTRERMSISSVKRVWDFLVEVIETL